MVMCKLELYITIPQIHMQTSGMITQPWCQLLVSATDYNGCLKETRAHTEFLAARELLCCCTV